MLTVNFFGGPGVGKSTLAADTFASLKKVGHTAELVGEYAKELQYDHADNIIHDQLYLFAEQVHRMRRLQKSGRIDFAICDSPLLLNVVYNRSEHRYNFNKFVKGYHDQFHSVNFFIPREQSFFEADRREEDYDWAVKKDSEIIAMLDRYDIGYYVVLHDELHSVLEEIEKRC